MSEPLNDFVVNKSIALRNGNCFSITAIVVMSAHNYSHSAKINKCFNLFLIGLLFSERFR